MLRLTSGEGNDRPAPEGAIGLRNGPGRLLPNDTQSSINSVMASLNKVFLIGHLTRDPELRTTPKGRSCCTLGLALNRRYRDEAGAVHDEATFVDVEAWGKQAEVVTKYLKCGSPACVEGRLKLDQWEDKESGQKRSRLKVLMEGFQFVGSSGSTAEEGDAEAKPARAPAGKGRKARSTQEAGSLPATEPGDDIPF